MFKSKRKTEKRVSNNSKGFQKINRKTWIANGLIYFILTLIALTMILPFVHELAKSFSYPTAVEAGKVNLVPKDFSFGNYYYYWRKQRGQLGRALYNTLFITIVGTLWGVFNTAFMAFPLSRPKNEFKWGVPILSMVVFCFVFQKPLIPYFLTVKSYGLMNTHGALIFPHTVVPFYLFLMLTFFRGFPQDIIDACRIDGANEFQIFFKILLPLSKAVLATVGIFSGVQLWNLFFHPLIFIRSSSLMPLQPIVRSIMQSTGDVLQGSLLDQDPFRETESIKSALIILTTIPIAIAFPFFQKYFTKGTMIGSIKT